MDIGAKVKEIISKQLDLEEENIAPENTFEELEADSLDVVELVMNLEEEFNLEIADEEIEKIKTVADIVQYVEEHA